MITHLKIPPLAQQCFSSLKRGGTLENLKSFYILETPSFEKHRYLHIFYKSNAILAIAFSSSGEYSDNN